jgi:DNA helicase-2/ATP-dependent DNA helicase PcrA
MGGMSFTQEQQNIINHSSGHALVNAVAGSGKTTVMVSFIEKLASTGIDPKKVLVLMFNKTAREDFQNRLRLVHTDFIYTPYL